MAEFQVGEAASLPARFGSDKHAMGAYLFGAVRRACMLVKFTPPGPVSAVDKPRQSRPLLITVGQGGGSLNYLPSCLRKEKGSVSDINEVMLADVKKA